MKDNFDLNDIKMAGNAEASINRACIDRYNKENTIKANPIHAKINAKAKNESVADLLMEAAYMLIDESSDDDYEYNNLCRELENDRKLMQNRHHDAANKIRAALKDIYADDSNYKNNNKLKDISRMLDEM